MHKNVNKKEKIQKNVLNKCILNHTSIDQKFRVHFFIELAVEIGEKGLPYS